VINFILILLEVAVVSLILWAFSSSIGIITNETQTQAIQKSQTTQLQYLSNAFVAANVTYQEYLTGRLDVTNNTALQLHFWMLVNVFTQPTAAYFGRESDGALVGYEKSDNNITEFARLLITGQNSDLQEWVIDSKGNPISLVVDEPYDLFQRPWFIEAKAAGKPIFSSVYQYADGGAPGITACIPIYQNNVFIGVIAIDLSLYYISQFLSKLELIPPGTAFVIDRSVTSLIASSDLIVTYVSNGQINELSALDSPNGNIREAVIQMTEQFGTLYSIQNLSNFIFNYNGNPFFGSVIPVQNPNVDWLLILIIPRSFWFTTYDTSLTYSIVAVTFIFIFDFLFSTASILMSISLTKITTIIKKANDSGTSIAIPTDWWISLAPKEVNDLKNSLVDRKDVIIK